mmetsp:Transcript_42227/g.111275  ORF Transcript_42227/g.111275 Transcript_42227/m.111275 type:complete len:93 (-) Transcript_42227:22-300(-)
MSRCWGQTSPEFRLLEQFTAVQYEASRVLDSPRQDTLKATVGVRHSSSFFHLQCPPCPDAGDRRHLSFGCLSSSQLCSTKHPGFLTLRGRTR